MAKEAKIKTANIRLPKPKTAAQKQKAAENSQLAVGRLKELQAKQKLANEYRKKYRLFGMTDEKVIEQANEIKANEIAAEWNNVVLEQTGGTGYVIKCWLKERINSPASHVQFLIRKFLKRDKNASHAHKVERVFAALTDKKLEETAAAGRQVA